MAETRLYSIAAIAKALDVPESTLHYWKNRFDDVLPSVGRGRGKRFRAEALDIFRAIGRMLAQGMSSADVRATLARTYPVNVAVEPGAAPEAVSEPAAMATPPARDAALAMAAHIGAEIARSLAVHLKDLAAPVHPGLSGAQAAALESELAAVRAENASLSEKMRLLETELVRLRKDRRELENYLVDKINALRRDESPS
ncbi:helix-turn-helix domain-containing protein [Solidesulfovibrio alcoholivorans]|uniref:helix-turn-helix domain-containing protein n=1 Tax=Solidesulfovibrio alcoholivorans TaxID=81406 RepID=UPI000497457D|nr:helix-turn-helix domain-containing protein [Solidesulfovibrio alcoholivorans]